MKDSSLVIAFGAVLLVTYLIDKLLRAKKENARVLPLPPGPKGLPFVGNLRDMPTPEVLAAHHWAKHRDLYGTHSYGSSIQKSLVWV
ncbi:O-Methylsterigmatocystin oxidoreductase [Colletotrichum higginsianum]|nr:O-Methylsterigmatocystin oxidoreductase [Colletotrichum higginsianum]